MSIRVVGLQKKLGGNHIVRDVSFEVRPGELVALLGPSGSGKSTVLRMIAGLETVDAGEVWLEDRRVDTLDVRERNGGFVFQHYALFRHMTVGDNIAFGLQVRGVSADKREARVRELCQLMGLSGLADRLPAQLSGGQRQRVALARALAPQPSLLLLDEPFGAVDAKVREELRRWLRRLHDEVHTTSLFVTHDQEEAFAVADRVMILSQGQLEQADTPEGILDRPATEFVARFVGDVNVLDAVAADGVALLGGLRVPSETAGAVHVVVRAYDLKLWRAADGAAGHATVRRVLPLGDRVRVEAVLDDGQSFHAQFPRRSSLLHGVEPGGRVEVEITTSRVFPARS